MIFAWSFPFKMAWVYAALTAPPAFMGCVVFWGRIWPVDEFAHTSMGVEHLAIETEVAVAVTDAGKRPGQTFVATVTGVVAQPLSVSDFAG